MTSLLPIADVPWLHLALADDRLVCARCTVGTPFALPMTLPAFDRAIAAFQAAHQGCPPPALPSAPGQFPTLLR